MNRIFYSSAETFLFRLSNNAEHYKSDKGVFKVSYRKNSDQSFPTLLEAFLFYMTLEEEADLWHIANETTLIESKVKMCLN